MNHTTTDLAYLAGIIDGEGSVSIHSTLARRKFQVYVAQVIVVNSHVPLIDWLHSTFGGIVNVKSVSKKGFIGKRRCYTWTIIGYNLDRLLPLVSPYMIVKKQQVDSVIEFRGTFGNALHGRDLPDDVKQLRNSLCLKVKALNAPPTDPSTPLPLVALAH